MIANENCGKSDKGKGCHSHLTREISLSVSSPENNGPFMTIDGDEEHPVRTVGMW